MKKKVCLLGAVLLCTGVVLSGVTAQDLLTEDFAAKVHQNNWNPDPQPPSSAASLAGDGSRNASGAAVSMAVPALAPVKGPENAPRGSRNGGDTCAVATVIGGLPYNDLGTTVGFNNDYDEVCPYTGSTSPDVVYSYTPGGDCSIDITLCGLTDYDSKLYVYEGSCPGTLVACNDDECVSELGQSYVSELLGVGLSGGVTYYIIVDGYGGDSGNYEIDVTGDCGGGGGNGETCGEAIIVGSLPYSALGTTVGFANDYDEACPYTGSSSPDVAYRYTPAANETIEISLCGAGTFYDTKLYVYENSCPGTLTACNDDACPGYISELSEAYNAEVALSAGSTYYIIVDGYGGDAGDYQIDIVSTGGGGGGEGCGNCGEDHCAEGGGCEVQACQDSVCSYDPFCCDVCWDGFCADEAWADPNCGCVVPDCDPCEICYSNTTDDWITNVTFGDINNDSGQEGACSYGNYRDQSSFASVGSTTTLTVTFYSEGIWTECVTAWFDWDGDCEFTPSERYDLGCGVDATLEASITVPGSAVSGNIIMRVMEKYSTPAVDACTDYSYGETEDYTVSIGEAIGACCDSAYSGGCADDIAEGDCGGTFMGHGSECDPNDCNGNGISDGCELEGNDCNFNGIPDDCELAGNDCNGNQIPDDCEEDCNGNGIPDDCDAADCGSNAPQAGCGAHPFAWCDDCNGNGVLDECDVAAGVRGGGCGEIVYDAGTCDGVNGSRPSVGWDDTGYVDDFSVPQNAGTSFGCVHAEFLDFSQTDMPVMRVRIYALPTNSIPNDLSSFASATALCDNTYSVADGSLVISERAECYPGAGAWDYDATGPTCTLDPGDYGMFINFPGTGAVNFFASAAPDGSDNGYVWGVQVDAPSDGGMTFAWKLLEGEGGPGPSGGDCDGNCIPDDCDIAGCGSGDTSDACGQDPYFWCEDCDGDGVPDGCQLEENDCDVNCVPDHPCQTEDNDCNGNNIPDDECELPGDPDCNNNGTLDECELVDNDCNDNGVPDECDIAPGGGSGDCNGNGIPDECDADCNGNGIADECDIADCPPKSAFDCADENAWCRDCNGDSVPDGCQTGGGLVRNEDALISQLPNQVNGIFSDVDCNSCGTGIQVLAEQFILTEETTIGSMRAWVGFYPGDSDPADDMTVIFRADDGGVPGAAMSTQTGVPTTRVQTGVVLFGVHEWDATLTLAPVTLGAGVWWVEMYGNTAGNGDTMFWEVGDLDTVNGIIGQAWTTTVPEEPWNFDAATDMAFELYKGGAIAGEDCNGNCVPDDCDIDPTDPDGNGEVSPDCNGDGIPDECQCDCNGNGIPDDCDIASGSSPDCNEDGFPDECNVAPGCQAGECFPDECSADCQPDGVPDECQVSGNDCNENGIPDDCELEGNDCNENGIPDECDLNCEGALAASRDSGNCCVDHCDDGGGCEDAVCEASVCGNDPFCCDVCWDGLCADEAAADPNCDCSGGGGNGETCAEAMLIGELPFNDFGTTLGFANDYDEVCPYSGSTSADVAYRYTPSEDESINITLCGQTDYDSKLYVYQGSCPGGLIACNDDSCVSELGQSYVSQLNGVALSAGQSYYIIVDGYGGSDGNYEIEVTSQGGGGEGGECDTLVYDSGTCDGVNGSRPTAGWTEGGYVDDFTLPQGGGGLSFSGVHAEFLDFSYTEMPVMRVRIYALPTNSIPADLPSFAGASAISDHTYSVAAGTLTIALRDECYPGAIASDYDATGPIVNLAPGSYGMFINFPGTGAVNYFASSAPDGSSNGYVWGPAIDAPSDGGMNFAWKLCLGDFGPPPCDCNENGIPDDCDIDCSDPDGNGEVSLDCNCNGVPDECEEAEWTALSIVCPGDLTVECDGTTGALDAWLDSAFSVGGCGEDCGGVTLTHDFSGLTYNCGDGSSVATVTWTASDECGANTVSCSATFAELAQVRTLIIKQGACPAPVNPGSHGVVLMALIGDMGFDVADVNQDTVQLGRCDGMGGFASPSAGSPPGFMFADLNHPNGDDVGCGAGQEPCACNADNSSDGMMDLKMKFRTDDMVAAGLLDGAQGEIITLVLCGELSNGCKFEAYDCVRLVQPGTSSAAMTVTSNEPGVWVEVAPADEVLDGEGFADFVRYYPLTTEVTLVADRSQDGIPFYAWQVNGVTQTLGQRLLRVTVDGDSTVNAVYDWAATKIPDPDLGSRGSRTPSTGN